MPETVCKLIGDTYMTWCLIKLITTLSHFNTAFHDVWGDNFAECQLENGVRGGAVLRRIY